MAVLSGSEIKKLIKEKKIVIKPFNKTQIGAGSIDLHLGDTFRIFKNRSGTFDVNDNSDYKDITELLQIKKGENISIKPGELIHGITIEDIRLPKGISARIEGRSRFARVGLLTHLSSGFMQPGTHGKIVLEIANLSPLTLAIKPGTAICQIVLEEVKGDGVYRGRFSKQTRP